MEEKEKVNAKPEQDLVLDVRDLKSILSWMKVP